MKVIDSFDASDVHDVRTVYTVALDDGRTIDVMRKHSRMRNSAPLEYVMDPHDDDIDCGAVLAFLSPVTGGGYNREH